MMIAKPLKIAIVRLTAMGDIIHTMASLQFIKDYYPNAQITWFVEDKFKDIPLYNPHIDKIIPLNLHSLKNGFSLAKIANIKKNIKSAGSFDIVIDVQGLIKSAIVSKQINAKVRAGLDRDSAREGFLASVMYDKKYRVDCAGIAPLRFASLIAQALDMKIDEKMIQSKKPFLYYDKSTVSAEIESLLSTDKKNILIVAGASHQSKIYPKEKMATVCQELKEHNVMIVAGSKSERADAEYIAQNSSATLLPPVDLNTLKYVVSQSDLLIGADTGPSHMAWALNRASIVLFGSTPVSMMMQSDINIALSVSTPANPCRFDKNDYSISEIEPDLIVKKAKSLL